MLETIIILALLSACLLQCFKKWGWLDFYEAVRKKWMPSGSCYLCLGFWITVFIALPVYWLFALNVQWLLYPFCAAPIINYLASPRL